MVIDIPEPCVVLLIGAAGAGKSTFAARHFATTEILSSDAFRAMVSGRETDQQATRTAFAILNRQLGKRLLAGRTSVIDATNVTPYARRTVLRAAAASRTPVVAIVFDLEPEIVLGRNSARPGRVVPEEAVRHQLEHLARSLEPGRLDSEAFAAIHRIRTSAELDAVEVRRSS
ncbi:MAG TPA: AAA family ATPase [Candidatus Limnocylindrales bacterium]|nr:AAA family ATPase [Candidatus Limnocylindrales bacterium]